MNKQDAQQKVIAELPSVGVSNPTTLLEARLLYTRCRARLVVYAEYRGIVLVNGEGYVINPRLGKPRDLKSTTFLQRTPVAEFLDRMHVPGSTHYVGCGGDELVYAVPKAGGSLEYVSDGGDPVYAELGEVWKGLHPACRWGGDFGDADHFSIEFQGVK